MEANTTDTDKCNPSKDANSVTPPNQSPRKRAVPKNLNMTKLGKADLLRLLSILEGELEARDIYITTLQAQLNRDGYVKKKYFHHGISDPFLALMRDNEAISGTVTPSEESIKMKHLEKENMGKIEPLPLLEKVVNKYKKQQDKVKQHMALSDAYYNLVNEELVEEKKKGVLYSSDKHNVSNQKSEEMENLKTLVALEKNRSSRIESEYKKLLQLVSKERQKFKMIVTLFLEERAKNDCQPTSAPSNHLQEKIQELTAQNQKLEMCLQEAKESETKMLRQMEYLFQQEKVLQIATEHQDSNSVAVDPSETDLNLVEEKEYETPSLPPKTKKVHISQPGHSLNSADDVSVTTTISVKRTGSIIEKRTLHKGFGERGREQKIPEYQYDALDGNSFDQKQTVGFRMPSPNIVSSPTSGAANFALNSPNQPNANTPFPIPSEVMSYQYGQVLKSSQFEVTRQKFQKNSTDSSTRSGHPERENDDVDRKSRVTVETTHDALPAVKCDKMTNKAEHKPQPPKPLKVNQMDRCTMPGNAQHDQDLKAHPPPVPPKKPNLLSKPSSSKVLGAKPSKFEREESKKTGQAQIKDRPSRLTAPKVSANPKLLANTKLATPKRPSSLNSNNSNSSGRSLSKRSTVTDTSAARGMQPKPPGSGSGRLSAQQRLFQDGGDGELRSPITKTVPKSPLGPGIFTFK